MNRNLIKQIKMSKDEKVYYDFNKLRGKTSDCRILLTTRRLIIYNDGVYYQKKRKIRRKGINEIQRSTITHVEYFIEYIKSHYISKMIGFILMLIALTLAVLKYDNSTLLPVLSNDGLLVLNQFVLINDLIYYVPAGILFLIGLVMIFKTRKSLVFRVVSGHMDDYSIYLKKNKYNEESIKKISTKLYL